MKSAFELAMERLEKASGPARKLTDEQKARIAEIETKYEAKIAELRLAYDQRIGGASTPDELNTLKNELGDKLADLATQRDKEKDAVWNEA